MAPQVDLVVVGGGPVGVAMGLFAVKRGLTAVVIERDAEVYNKARAIGMDDEIQRIFQGVGLADQLRGITTRMRGAEFVDAGGTRIIGLDLPDDFVSATGHAPNVFFHQPDLEALLREEAISAGVRLLVSHDVIGFEASTDEVVTSFTNLADRSEHSITSRWMVGADGASSRVRKALGFTFDDLGFDQDWLVVDTRLERDVELPTMPQQICDFERPVTFVPGFDRARRWEFQLQDGENRADMERHENVWRLLAPWMHPGDATIERAVVYRFHATVSSAMRSGRVFLAGDSAHQMPPFLGQGLCAGLRDAANLAWRLETVKAGRGGDRLLDAYDIERRPHVTQVVAYAVETGKLIDQLAGRTDDGIGTEAAYGGDRPFPHLTAGQLAGDHPLTGRQLPQPLIDGQLLDGRLGTGWALVSADGSAISDDVCERWRSVGATVIELGDAYAQIAFAPPEGVVIVRPDKFVAAATSDATELANLTDELLAWFS